LNGDAGQSPFGLRQHGCSLIHNERLAPVAGLEGNIELAQREVQQKSDTIRRAEK
jgi:hypothetical protein